MKIPKHFQVLIDKYRNGFEPEKQQGRAIKPNPIPDYDKFVEYLINRKRENTVRNYLNYLHKWDIPINEQNLSAFDESINLIDENRHKFREMVIHKNGKTYTYHRKHKFDNKTSDELNINLQNLTYFMYITMSYYVKALNLKKLTKSLPKTEDVIKLQHNVKQGHLSEQEFEQFLLTIDDKMLRVLSIMLFYTGARIGELLYCKKDINWMASNLNEQVESIDIKVPREFAKAKEDQYLYFTKKQHLNEILTYIRNTKENNYLFVLRNDLNKKKTYVDIQREKNTFNDFMNNNLIKCGLGVYVNKLTIHSFRRSYIHLVYELSGNDAKLTSQAARHTTGIAMTDKYLMSDNQKVKDRLKEMM